MQKKILKINIKKKKLWGLVRMGLVLCKLNCEVAWFIRVQKWIKNKGAEGYLRILFILLSKNYVYLRISVWVGMPL